MFTVVPYIRRFIKYFNGKRREYFYQKKQPARVQNNVKCKLCRSENTKETKLEYKLWFRESGLDSCRENKIESAWYYERVMAENLLT